MKRFLRVAVKFQVICFEPKNRLTLQSCRFFTCIFSSGSPSLKIIQIYSKKYVIAQICLYFHFKRSHSKNNMKPKVSQASHEIESQYTSRTRLFPSKIVVTRERRKLSTRISLAQLSNIIILLPKTTVTYIRV